MFTHQNAGVWADLALILWAAGLRVCSAWCIATETTSDLKAGNYVQGTVLLVLRKQTSEETAFLDEVYQEVEAEVRRQLDTMRDMDDAKNPNFTDTDYQLTRSAFSSASGLGPVTQYRRLIKCNANLQVLAVRGGRSLHFNGTAGGHCDHRNFSCLAPASAFQT